MDTCGAGAEMALWKPDPSFYSTPREAAAGPTEQLAYPTLRDPAGRDRGGRRGAVLIRVRQRGLTPTARYGTMRVVPLSRVLLVISTVAGVLSVAGALSSDGQRSAQGGLAMLVALAGYVLVAGRAAPPRTRWALAAGAGILAVGMALQLYWSREAAEDFGWFSYGPLNGPGAPEGLVDLWRQSVDREQIVALIHLLAVGCFAFGVFALPGWRRPKRAALTAVLALVLLAFIGSQFDGSAVLNGLGTVWPALLATVVAVGLVALAGRRADHTWLVVAGTFLVAVAAAVVLDDLSDAWSVWWRFTQPDENTAFMAVAVVAGDGSPDVTTALETAAELAGPALLAVGALRASRTA